MSPRLALPLTLLAFACSAAPAAAQVQAPDEPAGAVPAEQVLVVGDSLAVGMKPFLGELLGADVTWDARTGRTTPEGLQRLRAALRHVTPQAVVISLGTNDGTDPTRFTSRLRRVLAAVPAGACVVWADINRPPRKGAFAALNRVLRAEAKRDGRLVVVDWDRAVTSGKVTLPDGLHPDAAGYAYRSRLVAAAVQRGCG